MAHGKGGKILVIDDEPMVRAAVGRVLSDEGYVVEFAADGAAALAQLATTRPDAILLDLMMPGMNGRQFLHALRVERGSLVPVVVMTAVHGLGQRALSLGATDTIEKPFDVDELLNKMALAVFRARQESTGERPLTAESTSLVGDVADVVVVIDRELAVLRRLEDELSRGGFTAIALPAFPSDAPRLLRALAPTAVVIAADTLDAGVAALGEADLAHLPLVVYTRDRDAPPPTVPRAVVLTAPSDADVVRLVELVSSRPIARGAATPTW